MNRGAETGNQYSSETIIAQTQQWIQSVVIDCNFCPFAARAVIKNSIDYTVVNGADLKTALAAFTTEIEKLNNDKNIETSFVIFPDKFTGFYAYLQLVEKAEAWLRKTKLEGIYQVASFHPDYLFAGAKHSDAANYTNRSPYPMLHILREESVTKALSFYKEDPARIPDNNIAFARQKGLQYMQILRTACFGS